MLAATLELGDQDIHLADTRGLVVLLEVGGYEETSSVARRMLDAASGVGGGL